MSGVAFPTTDIVDFLVLGAGAAGGVVAKELATAGFQVVVLEQGPFLRETDYSHDEIKYTFQPGLTNDPKVQPTTYRKSDADHAKPMKAIEYGRQVGGGSVHFTANYWRFHESDFHERSLFGEVSGADLADWPIAYADLEPYYTKAEYELGISGLAGRESLRGAALEAVPAAPHARKVLRRPVRTSHEKTRIASVSRSGRHSFRALSRSRGLRELRLLRIVRL